MHIGLTLDCKVVPGEDKTYTVQIITSWENDVYPRECWLDPGYLDIDEATIEMHKSAQRIKAEMQRRLSDE